MTLYLAPVEQLAPSSAGQSCRGLGLPQQHTFPPQQAVSWPPSSCPEVGWSRGCSSSAPVTQCVPVAAGAVTSGLQAWRRPCSPPARGGSRDRGLSCWGGTSQNGGCTRCCFSEQKLSAAVLSRVRSPFTSSKSGGNWCKIGVAGKQESEQMFFSLHCLRLILQQGASWWDLSLTLPGDNWVSPSLSWFCLARCGPRPTVRKKRDWRACPQLDAGVLKIHSCLQLLLFLQFWCSLLGLPSPQGILLNRLGWLHAGMPAQLLLCAALGHLCARGLGALCSPGNGAGWKPCIAPTSSAACNFCVPDRRGDVLRPLLYE